MKNKHGFTLIELTIVIAIIITLSVVGIRALQNLSTGVCSEAVINSLLNSARATAMARHTYTGIRFRKQDDTQYAVFITYDSNIPYPNDDKTIPFTALENQSPFNLGQESTIATDGNEATIVFSSQGKLVRKWVKVFPARTKDDIFGQYGLFPQDKHTKLSSDFLIIKTCNASKEFYINPYIGTLIDVNR